MSHHLDEARSRGVRPKPFLYGPSGEWWLLELPDGVWCLRCGRQLRQCGSCFDWQCSCPLPWESNVPAKDRKVMPNQHYGPDFLPYTRDPYKEGE
mgnify:CR=1 FL=1